MIRQRLRKLGVASPSSVREADRKAARTDAALETMRKLLNEQAEAAGKAEAEAIVMRERAERAERIKGEYFAVIENMEQDRDRWRDMFYEQSREHCAAQGLLCKALESSWQQMRKFQHVLNQYRERDGLEPVSVVPEPGEPPTRTAEEYEAKMKRLADDAPEPYRGIEERDQLEAQNP